MIATAAIRHADIFPGSIERCLIPACVNVTARPLSHNVSLLTCAPLLANPLASA
jgi:hypothetical protein